MDVAGQSFTLDPEGNRTRLVETSLVGGSASSDSLMTTWTMTQELWAERRSPK